MVFAVYAVDPFQILKIYYYSEYFFLLDGCFDVFDFDHTFVILIDNMLWLFIFKDNFKCQLSS